MDKGKRRSNFQNFGIHITKNHPHHPNFHLSWDVLPHLERKVPNSKNSPNWQHLTCHSCPATCQNDLPSHPTLFWQLSFIFLIAEFFKYFIFLSFWVFRVIINFGVNYLLENLEKWAEGLSGCSKLENEHPHGKNNMLATLL